MIVTAWIDPEDLELFNRQRDALFPAERNYLSAHVTLFHHIPAAVRQAFITYCAAHLNEVPTLRARVDMPFSLGKGTAYPVECQRLADLRARLRRAFADHLTQQDDRPWNRPHITVQNKVTPEEAKRTVRKLKANFTPQEIRVLGLEFHRYDGGPWTLLERLRFSGDTNLSGTMRNTADDESGTFVEKKEHDR